MTHAATVNALVSQLLKHFNSNVSKKHMQDGRPSMVTTAKALKMHQYPNVNHFEVNAIVQGLVEKFEVLNLDPLAESLRSRVDKLERSNYKWLPEALSLLIHLSDRPAENARSKEITLPEPTKPVESLSWVEVWGDMSWKDPNENIDYDRESSRNSSADDDSPPREGSRGSIASSLPVPGKKTDFHSYEIKPGQEILQNLERSQDCSSLGVSEAISSVSEQLALRQVLHLLQDFPSIFFPQDIGEGGPQPAHGSSIANVHSTTFHSLLYSYARIGRGMRVIRQFVSKNHSTCTAQAFSFCVFESLTAFDSQISRMESLLIRPEESTHLSIISALIKLTQTYELPSHLKEVIESLEGDSSISSIQLLDDLFERTCAAQESRAYQLYSNTRAIFYRCIRGYLKSVSKWMLKGELDSSEIDFFVRPRTARQKLSEFWHGKYEIREVENRVSAPKFLLPLILQIFNIGKDVALLKELSAQSGSSINGSGALPKLDINLENHKHKISELVPFHVTLQECLGDWVLQHSVGTSQLLCHHLLYACGGWQVWQELGVIYLGEDCYIFNELAKYIWSALKPINAEKEVDCNLLTDQVRHTLSSATKPTVSTVRAYWYSSTHKNSGHLLRSISSLNLVMEYPESIKNIIRLNSRVTYQNSLRLLLQLSYCSRALSQTLPREFTSKYGSRSVVVGLAADQRRGIGSVLSLRFSFLWFFNILQNHVINMVIKPLRWKLNQSWSNASTVDDLVNAHEKFTTSLATELFQLESDGPTRKILAAILELALSFHDFACPQERQLLQSAQKSHKRTYSEKEGPVLSNIPTGTSTEEAVRMQVYFKRLLKLFAGALREKARQDNSTVFVSLLDSLADGLHKKYNTC